MGADRKDLQNAFDVRQAYINFGVSEARWQMRVGRQELALGDERLVGADNYWDILGQTFDAVRLGYATAKLRVDAFTGLRVQQANSRFAPLTRRAESPVFRFKLKPLEKAS